MTLVTLPKKADPPLLIESQGQTLKIRRSLCSGRGWIAKLGERVRWGNAAETRADIVHFEQFGCLPPKGEMW